MKIEFKRSELLKAKGELTLALPSTEIAYDEDSVDRLNAVLAEIITKEITGGNNENTQR